MPSYFRILAVIGGLIISLIIFNVDGHFKGIAIYLTNAFPWFHLLIFLPLALLFYLSGLGVAMLGETPYAGINDVIVTAGFFAIVLLAIFITGTLVGNYFQYDHRTPGFRFFDIFIILTSFFVILYIPALYLGTPVLASIALFHAPLIVAGVIALCTGHSRLMGADVRAPLNTLNAYRSIFREHIGKRLGAHRHRPCCVRSRAVKQAGCRTNQI